MVAKRGLTNRANVHTPDVIAGTETWLNDSVYSNEFLPPSYQIFHNDRQTDTSGGGVFLAIKSNLIAREELEYKTNCESVWASIHIKGNPALFFGAFYRRHFGSTAHNQDYLKELDVAISKLPVNCQIMLAGDFNLPDVDWVKNYFTPGGRYPALSKQMIDIVQDYNVHQVVTSPTREDNILDLVFTNIPSLVQNVNILPGISDHDIVSVEILTSSHRIRLPRRKIFLFKKGNFDKINDDLNTYADSITSGVYSARSAGKLWMGFKHALTAAMERHIPSKTTSSNSNLPWFKHSHKRIMRRKRKAYDKARRTGTSSDWEVFRRLRRLLDRSLRKSRSEYLQDIDENLTSKNTKPFWRYIKSLRQSSTGVSTANGIATTPIDKANAMNSQFQSVFTKENCDNLPSLKSPKIQQMSSIFISIEGIKKLLKDLKPQKAPGPDGISPTILKECADSVAPLLQQIFQKSIDTGELPDDWLKANVSPI